MTTPTYARRLAALALAALALWPSTPAHAKAAHRSTRAKASLPSAAAANAQLRQELQPSPFGYDIPRILALVRQGADVNAEDDDGDTALMAAAAEGPTGAVRALLAAGAHVNAKNHDGNTALMAAAMDGFAASVRALLAAGAHVNAKNHDGRAALDVAKTDEIKSLLTQHGAVSGHG